MKDEQDAAKLFDKIRTRADEKRKARTKEKKKNDEFFTRMKNGNNPIDEINRRTGENK
jgi:hypothetical protein